METSALGKWIWLATSMGGLKTGPHAIWLSLSGKSFPSLKTDPSFLSFLKHVCDKKLLCDYCGHLTCSLSMMKSKASGKERDDSLSFMWKPGTKKSIPLLTNSACVRISESVWISKMVWLFPLANLPILELIAIIKAKGEWLLMYQALLCSHQPCEIGRYYSYLHVIDGKIETQ